ncbi:MAG: transferrin receptor-like dimerization domain-containing protein [Longimicrobiales bacterium]
MPRTAFHRSICWALGAWLLLHAPLAAQAPLRGFPADAWSTRYELEQRLRDVPSPDTIRERIRLLSEEPHHAGGEQSLRVAELILAKFRAAGLDAELERFEAYMPMPVERRLELVAPERYVADLDEPEIPEDKDSGDANQMPTYNAYSPDGAVTGELVYVNYGTPEDYEVLDSLGIAVSGRIVIARYGRSWRGIKPKVAAEHGAIGTILYSDPRDDGYWVGDTYPEGPMRPWTGVQRGSVMDMPTYPGDPLSPGWASEDGARKLDPAEVTTFSPIPVLPISYGDALPLLRNLRGPVAPPEWRGALPITYHIGPGPARASLTLRFEWQTRPLYNVVATIPGSRSPDQWIVWGNHHDAWVNGAEDPISGMVTVEEGARAFGELLGTGWRPARTIKLIGWDGEEWGLLGSTEWAEKYRERMREHGAIYLNSDSNGRGWLYAAGSHSLERFFEQVARDITDPQRGGSVLEQQLARRAQLEPAPAPDTLPPDTLAPNPDAVTADSVPAPAAPPTPSFRIDALGSGSDYTAFLDHVGLPSAHLSYGGDAPAGIYHSAYDSFDHYRRFNDTTFTFGVAEAQTLGTAVLRLADAPVLPLEFGSVVRTYRRYVDEILEHARAEPEVRALDLSGVVAALDRLDRAATRYEFALDAVMGIGGDALEARWAELEPINRMLARSEQALTSEAGLEQREWFKHLIYAPGFYTGYGVKTMPGIREAVEDIPDLDVARREAARVAAAIAAYAEQVEQAAQLLERIN